MYFSNFANLLIRKICNFANLANLQICQLSNFANLANLQIYQISNFANLTNWPIGQIYNFANLVNWPIGQICNFGNYHFLFSPPSAAEDEKCKRGRKVGQTATTKQEDLKIITKFRKLRPPGHYIDARMVHSALPKKLKEKVGRRTVMRRINAKKYFYEEKNSKDDPSEQLKQRRVRFCRTHEGKTAQTWKSELQAVADLSEFTWYPNKLQPRFMRLRCRFTYMNAKEKKQGPFQRPKRWFPKSEYQTTRKQWIFGMTTSNGKSLQFLVPKPRTAEQWAGDMKKKVVPFLKRCFPEKTSYQVLLDGEPLLHAAPARAALRNGNVKVLPNWPKYSAQLNPQEHVWSARVCANASANYLIEVGRTLHTTTLPPIHHPMPAPCFI